MSTKRIPLPAFNPEKFLAKEQKKAASDALPPRGVLFPIRFSRERRLDLIARLVTETPEIFPLERNPTRNLSAMRTLQTKIAYELTALGVALDRRLIEYLTVDVVCDPAWRRAARARKKR